MSNAQKVLVTGSAGRLGRAAVKALMERGHTVIGFDRVATPGLPSAQSVIGTLGDVELLHQAMSGVQCVIHLAATPDDAQFPRGEAPDDGDNFVSELVPGNIVGPYQLLEGARKLKIPRVILASTGQTVDGHMDAGNTPVTVGVTYKPRYLYACTKVFLEALGQVYAVQHGIAVMAVRFGWCPRDAGQVALIQKSAEDQDVFLSPGDAGRFFVSCVEAASLPNYSVVYVTSRPLHHLQYDLAPARRILGWEPQDHWPTGAEEF